jgi:hypothetical protein
MTQLPTNHLRETVMLKYLFGMPSNDNNRRASSSLFPLLTTALAAIGLISTAQAQVQVAGSLLINVDATTAPLGSLTNITNAGTMGGVFEARSAGETPVVAQVSGNGQRGILLDGNDYLIHATAPGGINVPADPSLTGVNPTATIEAWVLNPGLSKEETIVSWGHRGGGDGQNMSFNYGWSAAWGAVGHWGGADIGWDPSAGADTANPTGNPKSGVWHHLVYTFDGTTQRVYSDGVEKNSEPISLNTYPIPPVVIGAQMANDTAVEPGIRGTMTIARVRIHSEALTGAQVLNNYNFEKNNFVDLGSPLPFGPAYRYTFNSPNGAAPDGTIISNSAVGPVSAGPSNAIVRGAATFANGRVVLPGGGSASAPFVDLPNNLLSRNSTNNGGSGGVTFEGWVKPTGNRAWSRLFDMGSTDLGGGVGGEVSAVGGGGGGLDYLFLSAQDNTGGDAQFILTRRVIDIRNVDGLPTSDPAGPGYDSGNWNRDFHYAVTWDEASGQVLVYENGALVTGFSAAGTPMSQINDVNCWLGRSNWNGDANAQAEFDEFRVYPRALPPEQIRASYNAGPDSLATADPVSITVQPQSVTIQEFGSASFTTGAGGQPPIGFQWYKNNSPVGGQVGTTLSVNNVPASENGAQYFAVASNNIGGTSYYSTSQVAVLTVLADTNGPSITQVRANSATVIEVVFSEPVVAGDLAVAGNFSLSGPVGTPAVIGAVMGADNRRAVLTLDGPLTDCEFYVVTVTGVHDVSAAGNVTPPGTSSSFWYYKGAPGLVHRYTFNNSPGNAAGATVPDQIGTADATVITGTGATTFTGSRVTLSGGSSANAPYVDLPNGLLSVNSTNLGGSGQVTIEGWVKVTASRTWSRIFDFGSTGFQEITNVGGAGNGERYLTLSAQVDNDVNTHRFELTGFSGVPGNFTQDSPAGFNQDTHFAVTWDERTGQIRFYRNGVQQVGVTSTASMTNIQDVNIWLGRSNWTGDQNMAGEFDEFRIYNRALSAADVQRNTVAGADFNFGGLLGLNLTVVTNNVVTNTASIVRVLASFSNAGTQDLAAAGCVIYSSTDSNVVYISADGVLHAVGEGTATVSVSLGGFTDSEIIEVASDGIPPTLLAARANGAYTVEVIYSEPVDQATAEEASNYLISGPSGPLTIVSAERTPNQTRVILNLATPLPCEYITVTVSFVADQSPLFNQIPENSQIGFMHLVPASLKHRYTFNNKAGAGTDIVVPDIVVSGSNAIIHGSPATFTGDRIAINGGASGTAAYVDMPNGILSSNSRNNGGSGQVTFEGWTKITGSVGWSRILDIGSTVGGEINNVGGAGEGLDYLFYSAQEGGDVNRHVIDIRNVDGLPSTDPVGPGFATPNFGKDFHFALTWDEASGQVVAYENGTNMGSFSAAGTPMSYINDVNCWLGRSNWGQDGNMQGEFDEFRVYNRVLTPEEMAINIGLGPDNNLGQPLSMEVVQTNHVQIGRPVRPTVIVDFMNLSNLNVTASGCAVITSDNPTVLAQNAGGSLQAINLGTANVKTVFSGMTNTVLITVGYQMTFAVNGPPGATYEIQTAPEITGPWTTLTTRNVPGDPSGPNIAWTFGFEDTVSRGPQAFYRAHLVSNP